YPKISALESTDAQVASGAAAARSRAEQFRRLCLYEACGKLPHRPSRLVSGGALLLAPCGPSVRRKERLCPLHTLITAKPKCRSPLQNLPFSSLTPLSTAEPGRPLVAFQLPQPAAWRHSALAPSVGRLRKGEWLSTRSPTAVPLVPRGRV